MFLGWSRRSGAAPAACWVTAHAVKFSNPQPRIVRSPPKIVRFSKLPSWVTAPLAPGGAGRQRERLLWSCCDQGSAPAACDQGRGAWSAWNAAELVRLHPRAVEHVTSFS